jgi:hypothetical protein
MKLSLLDTARACILQIIMAAGVGAGAGAGVGVGAAAKTGCQCGMVEKDKQNGEEREIERPRELFGRNVVFFLSSFRSVFFGLFVFVVSTHILIHTDMAIGCHLHEIWTTCYVTAMN